MALPVTIGEQIGQQNSWHGPFLSSNGDVFAILVEVNSGSDGRAMAFRATDPTSSFTESDSSNRPIGGNGITAQLLSLNCRQYGDEIHMTASSVSAQAYFRFDMAGNGNVGTWDDVTTTGGDKDQTIDSGNDGVAASCDLVIRTTLSTPDVLALFQWTVEADMGTNYERIAFDTKADLTTGAWGGSPAYIGTSGMGVAVHVTGPRALYDGRVSQRTHVMFNEDGEDVTTTDVQQIAHSIIEGDDGVVNLGDITEAPTVLDGTNFAIGKGVIFIRDNVVKLRWPYIDTDSDLSTLGFDEPEGADTDPMAQPTYIFEDGVDGTNNVSVDNGAANACLAVANDTVHAIWGSATNDDDIYTANDAGTDTYGSVTEARDAVTCNHISANIYYRNDGLKLAFIYDDAGTPTYDEEDISPTALAVLSTPQMGEISSYHGPFSI